jgi:class 3 adenylate cyclase/tetratricopeptide (TPR) repeat protein
MERCPSCGRDLPGAFPFCPFCAASLDQPPAPTPPEERRVVTVIFCDLAGFTARSDAADPEDVRARIRPYSRQLRAEIERYGGTVEKFVGDAVMAVFGAPVAHEDDAERAVRSGLRILEAIEELNEQQPELGLQVRVGINTGEAVVVLGAHPEQGEGIVTGDVVNTASRLQASAPVGAVAVGERTYRQTREIFDYTELEPVSAKGKPEPLQLWQARSARARFGTDLTRTHRTPLVGREPELTLLRGTFERALRDDSVQLVTVVGEPGLGKSRLVAEFFRYIDDEPGLTIWRQGRCLPYGEGISFWALGEIVKAQAGILESDSPAEAASKLSAALPARTDEREWLLARLAPLVGATAEPADQEECFTAWRRFLESLAADHPTVLVFEDLHWADEALLSFLEHLADWSQGIPLLILCTARPELYARNATWAGGTRNATTINLAPLTDEETARLVAVLLQTAVLPADVQALVLERAGGNPLYAEEFVRMLNDRQLLVRKGRTLALEEGLALPFPDSLQALIAARLDLLTPVQRALLQDASVIGKIFWAGAVARLSGLTEAEVRKGLRDLSRKELVRPARSTSMEGEAEYSFWHLLVRDVSYGQIPRTARAARHRAAAVWLEHKAGDRVEDLADVLAHHYVAALELARAAGQSEQIDELEANARRFLALAGERALQLDIERAESSLAKALRLAPGGAERAGLLERWAQATLQLNRLQEAQGALEEALALYRERGDSVAAGRVLTALTTVLQRLGDPRGEETLRESLSLLEAQPPGPELVAAQAELAARRAIGSAYTETVTAAEQALQLAAELDLAEPARALGYRGYARCMLGDRSGLDDMRRALELALEQGQSRIAAILYNNLALARWPYEGPGAVLDWCSEGIEFCERRGIVELALAIAETRLPYVAESGNPQQALAEAGPLAERLEAAGFGIAIAVRSTQLRLLAERGDRAPSVLSAEQLAERARETGEFQLIAGAFQAAAQLLLARGRPEQARTLLRDLKDAPGTRSDPYYWASLADLVRCALTLQDSHLAAELAAGVEPRTPLAEHALAAAHAALTEATGEHARAALLYAEAADSWRRFGNVPERAYALLGEGRCRLVDGTDAPPILREARAIFVRLEARPSVEQTDALLRRTAAAAS